jgi:eukaryotic-like serine/threonine-protein kinase
MVARHNPGSPGRSRRRAGDSLSGTMHIDRVLRPDADSPTLIGPGPDAALSVSCSAEQALELSRSLVSPGGAPGGPQNSSVVGMQPPEVRYEDQGEIGRGGMGTVRRTFDRVLMRSVAMKLIEPSVATADLGARFVEEAQITGQLDHPNIVPVYEFGTVAGSQAYFTMKLVSGQTLSEVIAHFHADAAARSGVDPGFARTARASAIKTARSMAMRGTVSRRTSSAKRTAADERKAAPPREARPTAPTAALDLEHILGILLKVCEAVAFAHSRGVIHRDLKPANIMIGTHGQVYVMDWGLGLLLAGQRAADRKDAPAAGPSDQAVRTSVRRAGRSGNLEGTVAYMAPEQALGADNIDARTDVFALGAILYEVLTGRPPYIAPTQTQGLVLAASARVIPPQEAVGHLLPPGLCDIAMRAMQRDPASRYQTVDEVHAALESFLRGGGWFATRTFQAGEVIVREGEAADSAYVIVEGRCEAYRERKGARTRLRVLEPGDVFGETALLSAQTRTASVAALDTVTVKVVTADAFERELGRSSWMGAVVKQLAARFLELERQKD